MCRSGLKFYFIYHLDGKSVFFSIHFFTLVAVVGVSKNLTRSKNKISMPRIVCPNCIVNFIYVLDKDDNG